MTDELSPHLGALQRLASVGPLASEPGTAIGRVIDAIKDLVACENAVVLLREESADHMSLYLGDAAAVKLNANEPSVGRRVFETGTGEVVNDLASDPDSSPVIADRIGAHQLVASPLDIGGHRIGVIGAINSKHGAFNQEDLIRLSLLAEPAALAIENERLTESLQRQSQEIEGLHRMTRLMTLSESFDHVVDGSVRIVADLLECERVALLLHDEALDALVAHPATIGISKEQGEALRIPMSQPSLPTTVFRTDAPLISNDATTDAWISSELKDLGVESVLIAPLSAAGDRLGVLCAIDAKRGGFTDEEIRLAGLLTSSIAGVLELSQARERERALVQKLRETDHTKSEFVSMLAHELKGPMTTIMGFGQVLRDQWPKMPDEKRNHILDIVMRETTRLARLVSDLLDLSRMEAGTLHFEMDSLSLADVVRTTLEVHESLRDKHAVVTDVPEDLPAIWGDPDRLRQVILNLIGNATRYSPEGTTITLNAVPDQDGRTLRVSVTDEGIGISPDDHDKVFSKFVMLEKPAWVKKGTGLGLYITKGIVEGHGGRMWIESTKGEGSTFFFALPLAR